MSARIPTATYRLQLNHRFTFARAADIVDYLADLGISDCYASPIFTAVPNSMHGYDVTDHSRLNPEVGDEQQLKQLATKLAEHSMGLILDIVPNHMCIAGSHNGWWNDVLENGPSSPFARHFDIDWNPPKSDLSEKVLLPILGDQYGRVLENQEISIRYENDAFVACFYDSRLPIAPRTWSHILEPTLDPLRQALGEQHVQVHELESILTSLGHLPLRTETDEERVRERRREKDVAKRRLKVLFDGCAEIRQAIDDSLKSLNGVKGDPRSFDSIEALLAEQGYRPCFWRVAADEINYRRFFDINELAAIRIEEPSVFDAVHEIPLRLAQRGLVSGLRIDHIDGLLEPEKYLVDVQRAWRDTGVGTGPAGIEADRPCFVIVEKILGPDERLPTSWPVHGTTGYEFANLLNGLFVDQAGVSAISRIYRDFTGQAKKLSFVVYESKKAVLKTAMAAELTVLARKLDRISEQNRSWRDFTLDSLQEALAELVACFPVYRTYVREDDVTVRVEDRAKIETAVHEAKRRNPATDESIFDFLRDLLLLEDPTPGTESDRAARRNFVLRFQQLAGPVMAKGLEDTAFYRHFPLASFNEVGGGIAPGTISVDDFHRAMGQRMDRYPHGLSATSTHDTKRSEDVRARLWVLSEIPDSWERALKRWASFNEAHKELVDGEPAPDPNEEYLLYQTLVGAWPVGGLAAEPDFTSRIQAYLEKALKEAKIHTSWISPDEAYDSAVKKFVAALLDPAISSSFLADFSAFQVRLESRGFWNSLSQVLLKIASPGVPDFFQGSELWDFSLVDPDNRRPVDFDRRQQLFTSIKVKMTTAPHALAEELMRTPGDGRLKLFVTSQALAFRRAQRALFENGRYVPLAATGEHAESVVAFARKHKSKAAVFVTTRFSTRLGAPGQLPLGTAWTDTVLHLGSLAAPSYRDVLTGREISTTDANGPVLSLAETLVQLPVALLEASA